MGIIFFFMFWIFWIGVAWLVCALAVGIAAANKGKSFFAWFFLAILISPLLAAILLIGSRDERQYEAERAQTLAEIADTKSCPKCAERVKVAAEVCRYCGYNFQPGELPQLAHAPKGCPVDPFVFARRSEKELRDELRRLSMDDLKLVAVSCGMDPAGYAQNWKKRGDLELHIIQEAMKRVNSEARAQYGRWSTSPKSSPASEQSHPPTTR